VVVEPDDIDDLVHELGSVESLKKSCTWGLSSNCRQIRPIVEGDRPLRAAIDVRDQCVAFGGLCSSVAITTFSSGGVRWSV